MHQSVTDTAAAQSSPETGRQSARYLAILLGGFALFVAIFAIWGLRGRDHFAQIPYNGDMRWYRNYAHLVTREMQDRDVLYHGIGKSIENLKKADIVLLGHSVLEFAVMNDQVEEFQKKHGVRIFNLTNPGIASGEYMRRLIRKWNVRPKIWIINADDFPANFFNPKMDDFFASGRNATFKIVETSWLKGFQQVAARGIRWRIEDWVTRFGPKWLRKRPYSFMANYPTTWRNIETGNFVLERANGFNGTNPPIKIIREQSCSISPQEVEWARDFTAGIGGTTLLTLVPYERWCPERVRELADELALESFFPPDASFSVFDGTHMDRAGGTAYTAFLLSAIEKSRAFQLMKGLPDPGAPKRASTRPEPTAPVKLCVTNTGAARMFVSVRFRGQASDHIVAPGATLTQDGFAGGQLCSSVNPFNRDQCPDARSQTSAACP